jgi:hypothetical protein
MISIQYLASLRGASATKQSGTDSAISLDCFASLAMTMKGKAHD